MGVLSFVQRGKKTPWCVGLSEGFRQPRGKPECPQHFAFPEVSRETRGCLVLHSVSLEFPSGNSRVSLSLRAGLGQNLGQNLGNRQTTGYFLGIPGGVPGTRKPRYFVCRFGRFGAQTSLRLGSEPGKLEGDLGKLAGNTERKPGRVREETLVQANVRGQCRDSGCETTAATTAATTAGDRCMYVDM